MVEKTPGSQGFLQDFFLINEEKTEILKAFPTFFPHSVESRQETVIF